jgi:hypothetical protein
MGLSVLAQSLIVSTLAYLSGLFLGIALYRGEIGPRRPRAPRRQATAPRPQPEPAPAADAPLPRGYHTQRRPPQKGWRGLMRSWRRVEDRARGVISAVLLVAALLAVAMTVYVILISVSPPMKSLR